jgi:hypothetical protein
LSAEVELPPFPLVLVLLQLVNELLQLGLELRPPLFSLLSKSLSASVSFCSSSGFVVFRSSTCCPFSRFSSETGFRLLLQERRL